MTDARPEQVEVDVYGVPWALYIKVEILGVSSLSNNEKLLLIARRGLVGRGMVEPETLTEEERYKLMLWPPPDIVRARIQQADVSQTGNSLHQLLAKPISQLNAREFVLLACSFYTPRGFRTKREGVRDQQEPGTFLVRGLALAQVLTPGEVCKMRRIFQRWYDILTQSGFANGRFVDAHNARYSALPRDYRRLGSQGGSLCEHELLEIQTSQTPFSQTQFAIPQTQSDILQAQFDILQAPFDILMTQSDTQFGIPQPLDDPVPYAQTPDTQTPSTGTLGNDMTAQWAPVISHDWNAPAQEGASSSTNPGAAPGDGDGDGGGAPSAGAGDAGSYNFPA
ncbi:hypothetical protein QBC46DRAFT_429632 [Diplogelasinospora grovesii]|uniref:Uncharacterized protein n=1 Tax=Diplogelasinospora grovesii TaxID=303347 RepID=A0AAN6S6F5_9PEZI|nr:hypothetical protein QBC46DRAFT_429632 [Diplogelasinospora grovesii]